jgi:hypothetical protein
MLCSENSFTTPIESDWLRFSPIQSGWTMRRSAVSELLEPSFRAAGLNFCVTLGGSETLQPVPKPSLLPNVKEQGAIAPLYYILSCIDFNESRIIHSFLRGGEKSNKRALWVGRAERRDPSLPKKLVAVHRRPQSGTAFRTARRFAFEVAGRLTARSWSARSSAAFPWIAGPRGAPPSRTRLPAKRALKS